MDLEQFEEDARAAFATGKYRLVCGQFGANHHSCCVLLMVLLHRDPPRRPAGDQFHCEVAAQLYGGDHRAWLSLLYGFDGVGARDAAYHPRAYDLGDRLAREFKVTRRGR